LHVLEALAGTSFCSLNLDLLKHDRYQLANLAGKRVAICSEANSRDNVVEDATIKALISGDTMVVRQIREQPFNLQPQAKLWWAMNKLPAVADTSDGFWRRIFLIPFNRTFADDERIPDLVDQLINELPGIFNWAMEGLKRLRANGGFTVPAQVERQTAEYRKDSNIVETFIEEECVVDQNDQVQSSVIYQAYRDWCKSNGYQAYSSRNFKRELNELGYPAKRYATAVFFLGINLRVSP
jgi:putative DNA primase/helicase